MADYLALIEQLCNPPLQPLKPNTGGPNVRRCTRKSSNGPPPMRDSLPSLPFECLFAVPDQSARTTRNRAYGNGMPDPGR